MATGKIRFEDIFETDIFAQAAESARALIEVLAALDETLKQIAKTKLDNLAALSQQQPTAEAIKRTATALRETEKAIKDVSNVSKQLEKAKIRLKELEGDHAKELAKLRYQIREAQKDMRAMARSEDAAAKSADLLKKAQRGVFESYHEMSDTLEKLRQRYKDLVASGQTYEKEAVDLKNVIIDLDSKIKHIDASVGQFQRNVGSYLKSMHDFWGYLKQQAGSAGGVIGGLITQVQGLGIAFKAAGGGLVGLGNAVKFLGRSLAASGIGLLLVVLNETIAKLIDNIKGLFTGGENLQRALSSFNASMQKLRLEYEIENLSILVDKYQDNIELLNRYYDKRLQLLLMSKNEALKQYNIDKQIYEASNKVLGNKQKAAEAVQRMQEQLETISQIEREILRLNYEREKAVEAILERQREAAEQAERERVQRLNELLQLMELEEERAKTNIEEINRQYNKQVDELQRASYAAWELARTERERLLILEKLDAKVQEIERNRAEQIMAVRQQLYDKLYELESEVTDNIIQRRLIQYDYEQRRLRAEISRLIAEFEQVGDVEALKKAREMELALEQKFARDIADIQVNMMLERLNNERAFFEQSLNLKAKEFSTVKEFEEWKNQQLLEFDIQFYRKRLELLHEEQQAYINAMIDTTTIDTMIAREEAALAMLELRHKEMINRLQDAGEETGDVMKKTLEEIARGLGKTIDLIDTLLNRIQSRQEWLLDHQLTTTRRRIDLLIAQVERGSAAAADSIIELEKREADIIKQQEQIKRKAQQREAALSAFRAYAAQLQQGATPAQALLNTIRDLTLITQMIRALPTYYSGTEYVRGNMKLNNTIQDAVLARLHVGERVVPADINKRLKGIKNEQLLQMVEKNERVTMDYDSMINAIAVAIRRNNKQSRIIRKI